MGNQTMKFGQLMNITREIFYFKNNAENESGGLVPDIFLFFNKTLYMVKANGLQLGFTIFQ